MKVYTVWEYVPYDYGLSLVAIASSREILEKHEQDFEINGIELDDFSELENRYPPKSLQGRFKETKGETPQPTLDELKITIHSNVDKLLQHYNADRPSRARVYARQIVGLLDMAKQLSYDTLELEKEIDTRLQSNKIEAEESKKLEAIREREKSNFQKYFQPWTVEKLLEELKGVKDTYKEVRLVDLDGIAHPITNIVGHEGEFIELS
jgi:hypothetical protein